MNDPIEIQPQDFDDEDNTTTDLEVRIPEMV